jgi:peptide/nickel transport system substrate-binding protein
MRDSSEVQPAKRSGGARARLRSGLVLGTVAVVASLAVAACGSSGGSVSNSATGYGTILYGKLPAVGTPVATKGATITIGQISGVTPVWFFPIASGADSATQNINLADQLMVPLYYGPDGAKPIDTPSLGIAAAPPVPSNGDKTYTITMKQNFKWADGTPVTATDAVFGFDLLNAAVKNSLANWGQIVPGQFPQSVTSIKATGPYTIQINLNKAYNPGYFLYNQIQDTNWGLYPMPAQDWNIDATGGPHLTNWSSEPVAEKIWSYLNTQAGNLSTWATNPLWKDGDGPYVMTKFDTTNSSYTLSPNAEYGGSPKPSATIDYETFTSSTAQLDALKSGTLDIGGLDPSQLAQVPTLKAAGYTVFGGPGFGWFGGIINFNDKTDDFNHVIAQQYVRGALYHLINEQAIIKAVYRGAAVPQYASVPSAPTSPYAPAAATQATYPFDPAAAVALLKSHGWNVVPGGTTTCADPGTGASECGAGIPKGTPIKFTWANPPSSYSTTAVGESTIFASEAEQKLGVDVELTTQTANYLFGNYDDQVPADSKYANDWGVNNVGGVYTDYYPTASGIWTPGGGFNFGDYNSPETNTLVNASVFGTNPDAVKTEVTWEAKDLPVFFFPALDNLVAVSNKVGGPANAFLTMTQQQQQPQYFYLTK